MPTNIKRLIAFGAVAWVGISPLRTSDPNAAIAREHPGEPALEPTRESAESPSGEKATATYDREVNLESFRVVWQTIKDTHWDEALAGDHWDEVRAKHRPRAEQAKSRSEMRQVIQDMINELGQSHFAVIPAEVYDTIQTGSAGNATTGLTLRLIGNEVVVTRVAADSPAAEAGIVPGWTLESFNGTAVTAITAHVKQAAQGPTRLETLAAITVDNALSGQEGEQLELVMTNAEGGVENVRLTLFNPPGTMAKLGHLPPMRVTYESRTLEGNIGYFKFNLFLDPVTIMPAYRDAVHRLENSNGLIIDLRGNLGGIGAMTMGMASELSDRKTKLGTMTTKGASLDFAVSASPNPVSCPVAVLIDEVSLSSAEVFAGGLQDMGVARIFGSRSAGIALPANVNKLPNGDGFMFAIANYVTASGKRLEREGVVPDEPIALSKELFFQDRDPVLSRAIEWIQSENHNEKPQLKESKQ